MYEGIDKNITELVQIRFIDVSLYTYHMLNMVCQSDKSEGTLLVFCLMNNSVCTLYDDQPG